MRLSSANAPSHTSGGSAKRLPPNCTFPYSTMQARSTSSLRSKIYGGLYGQALGDAFGMPALLSPAQTRARFGQIAHFIPAPDDHPVHGGLPAGRITDDTEQAIWLAREIIRAGGVTLEGTARALLSWYDAIGGDACPFVGPSTRRGIAKIRAGIDLRHSGLGGDTNGAAMRASVVGLIHPGDVEAAARDAALTALPTHNTHVACAAAAAVAGAVACALRPDAELRDILAASITAAQIGEKLGAPALGASVARRIELAISLARDEIGDDRSRLQAIYDLIGTGLPASEATPAAMGVVALADGDPMRAAMLAAELSGDADTIGAMACAVCGAWRGIEAIPIEMRQALRDANPDYDFDAVAAGLLQVALQASSKPA
ncbi:MAG: ADP-ribosylglycohydrolase family protein [Chloroflexi bacterium]|nr:MAG: ADP-ribosylglycohydrolase family protein [Chloroflexota bacterium]